MSDYIPVFAIVLDANELPLRLESCNDANDIVGVRGDLWESVSRNNWHQAILEKILKRRKEYSELLYLIQEIVCIHSTDLPRKIKALRSFLQDVTNNPDIILEEGVWHVPLSVGEVLEALAKAVVVRDVDSHSYELDTFFSYLRSQLAALEEAMSKEKCLLYVQYQP